MTEAFEQLAGDLAARLSSISGIRHVSIRTIRHENTVAVTVAAAPSDQLTFSYADWHAALSMIPGRSLRTWASLLTQAVVKKLHANWNSRIPVTFFWQTGRSSHAVGNSAALVFPADEQTGAVLASGALQKSGIIVCCEKCIALLDGDQWHIYAHDEMDNVEIDDRSEIDFYFRGVHIEVELYGRYENSLPADVIAYFSEERFPPYQEMFKANDADRIYKYADRILASKAPAAHYYLALLAYSQKKDYAFVCDIALKAASRFSLSLDLLDTVAPAFLKTGRFQEQLNLFYGSVAEILSVPETDRSMVWINFVGNTLVSVCSVSDSAARNEFARLYYTEDVREEWGASGRLYYHNFACLFAQLSDYSRWTRAIELAHQFGETRERIEGESDFASMLSTDAGRQFVEKLLAQEGRFAAAERRLTVNDMIRQRRWGQHVSLIKILKEKTPAALAYAREIMLHPFTSGMDKQECFFALLGAGGEHNLQIARKGYKRYGVDESWDFYPGFHPFSDFYDDAGVFEKNARDIMGDDANFLIENNVAKAEKDN